MHGHSGIRAHPAGHGVDGYHHAEYGRDRGGRAHHAPGSRGARGDGLVGGLPGKHSGGAAKGRTPFCAKACEGRDALRSIAVCSGPRGRCPSSSAREQSTMKMDLIQPFIGSLDSVLAQMTGAPVTIADVTMEEEGYTRKGIAAVVVFQGQIEGRVVVDADPALAAKVAGTMAGAEVDAWEPMVPEAICELANMVIGNAVSQLNDKGSQFKVLPPSIVSE